MSSWQADPVELREREGVVLEWLRVDGVNIELKSAPVDSGPFLYIRALQLSRPRAAKEVDQR